VFGKILRYPFLLRTSKGFGVHSPFAFRLIREVINERLPYYDYCRMRADASAAERKRLKLLYRLAVRFHAHPFLFFGDPGSKLLDVIRMVSPAKEILVNPSGILPENSFVVVGDISPDAAIHLPDVGIIYFHSSDSAACKTAKAAGAMVFNTHGTSIVVFRPDLPAQTFSLL